MKRYAKIVMNTDTYKRMSTFGAVAPRVDAVQILGGFRGDRVALAIAFTSQTIFATDAHYDIKHA